MQGTVGGGKSASSDCHQLCRKPGQMGAVEGEWTHLAHTELYITVSAGPQVY